VSASIAGRAF